MLRSLIVLLIFAAVILPNFFIPLVLSGVLDSAVPAETLLRLLGVVIVLGTVILVLGEISTDLHEIVPAIRGSRGRRSIRKILGSLLGAVCVASWLGYFSFSPVRYISALRYMQASVGSGWLFLLATGVWRLACNSHNAGVHLAYYCVATLVLTTLTCSLVDVVERQRPVGWLVSTRMCVEEIPMVCTPLGALSSGLWWFFGLSYDRLRAAVALATIAIVNLRYALTDRQHHVPTSPHGFCHLT